MIAKKLSRASSKSVLDVDSAVMIFHDTDRELCFIDSSFITKKITNFSGSACVFVVGKGVKLFVSDPRYEIQMEIEVDQSWTKMLDNKAPSLTLLEKVKGIGLKRLFIVGDFCDYKSLVKCREYLKDVTEVKTVSAEVACMWLGVKIEVKNNEKKKYVTIPETETRSTEDKMKAIFNTRSDVLKGGDFIYFGNRNFVSWLTSERRTEGFNRNVNYDLLIEQKDKGLMLKLELKNDWTKIKEITMGQRIIFDPRQTNALLAEVLIDCSLTIQKDLTEIYRVSNIRDIKECRNIKKAHKNDAIAMCEFFSWLDTAVKKVSNLTERSAATKLYSLRKKHKDFLGLSFPTISGFGKNGAIIHYSSPSKDVIIKPNNLYLIDSGGHYNFGTTDITRTVAIGLPNQEQKKMFTLVLKAHIALATSIFTKSTEVKILDSVCRSEMLKFGADYQHGTGHGIGYGNNVHDGPIGISKHSTLTLDKGMTLSNEPGFYKKGEYGIRIENVMQVVSATDLSCDFNTVMKSKNEGRLESYKSMIENNPEASGGVNVDSIRQEDLLGFETISLVPIDLKLIDKKILLEFEKDWINSYHKKIFNVLHRDVSESCRKWITSATLEI